MFLRFLTIFAGIWFTFLGDVVAEETSPPPAPVLDFSSGETFTLLWVRPPEKRAEKISSEAMYYLAQHLERPFDAIAWEISDDCYCNIRRILEQGIDNPSILVVVGFFRRDDQPALFATVPGYPQYWVERDVPIDGDPMTLAPLWATIWGNLLTALQDMPSPEAPYPATEQPAIENETQPVELTAQLLPRKRVVLAKFGTEFAASGAWMPSGKNARIGFGMTAVYSAAPPFAMLVGTEIYPPFGIDHEIYDIDFLSIPVFAGGRYYWESKGQELYMEVNAQARYSRLRLEDPSGMLKESKVHRTVIGMGLSAGYHYLFTDQISMFANYSLFWTPRGQEYAALGERLYLEPTFGMTLKLGMAMDWLK